MRGRPARVSAMTQNTIPCSNATIGAFGGPVSILAGGIIGGVVGGFIGSATGSYLADLANNGIHTAIHGG